MFWLPNMKILDKKRTFSVKIRQKDKYVKKQFLVSKKIILFYMVRRTEMYILECSKKQINIAPITSVFVGFSD